MMFGWILLLLIVLIVLRVRLAFALLLVSLVYFWFADIPNQIIPSRIMAATQSFPLLAIPLFILAGNLMNKTGMTERLFRFSTAALRSVPGGLGHVVVVVGMLMAGTSGAAIADAAALARISVDEMEKNGYPRPLGSVICAFAATMGPLIPPSIMFIIFSWLAGVSVNRLFIAGAIPGLLVGVFMMITILILLRNKQTGDAPVRTTLAEILTTGRAAFWPIIMPVVVLGGIIAGIFTATEAAAIAVVYALLVGGVIFRKLNATLVWEALHETVVTSSAIMLIVAASYPFGWILSAEQVPQGVLAYTTGISENPIVLLLIVNLMLLLLGMIMETTAVLLIVVPMLLPLMASIGVDPIQFGVIVSANLLLGTITPPFGILMFTVCSITNVSTVAFQKAAIPFYIAFLLLIGLVTYVPAVSLWLPSVLLD